jgi:predicted ATP-grasp superfamily ATP-dependent carboligase
MDGTDDAAGAAVVPLVYAPHAATCLRSLATRGVHTIGVYEERTPAFRSRYCDETLLAPAPDRDLHGYRDALRSLAARDAVRAIYPMREADVYVLAKYASEFAPAVEPLWPPFETLAVVHDRVRLVEAAREAGVQVPETGTVDGTDDWSPRQIVKARYALLAEEYTGDGMAGVTEPDTGVVYLDADDAPDDETGPDGPGDRSLVQEYIPGDEYALWALYDDGEPVATCGKHQIRAFDFKGGTSVYRETVDIPALERAGRALLDHLDWQGFASVQFKRDSRTGEFTLLEVNPRLWVSVACPVLAGLDFPYCYWELANGGPVTAATGYEVGVATHRIGGELTYLWSVLAADDGFVRPPSRAGAVRSVLGSLYRQPHFDYLRLDDPTPFVDDIAQWLGRLTESVARSAR